VSYGIRPSTTQSGTALWAKSLLNAALFFAVFMMAMPALAAWLLPGRLPLPSGLRVGGGGVLFAGGVAVWIACLDRFSRHGRGTPFPLDAPQQLVTSGPFGVIRNPIIAAELAVVWGEALYLGVLGVFLYAALLTAAGHLVVVAIEEPELRERFGPTYDEYCRRVPRWWPSRGAADGGGPK
jgi:protein-S-isoprenylcysteine O-methyltransferase Ste14